MLGLLGGWEVGRGGVERTDDVMVVKIGNWELGLGCYL